MNLADRQTGTDFCVAAATNRRDCVRSLIRRGKSVESTDENITISQMINNALRRVAPEPALISQMVDSGFSFARTPSVKSTGSGNPDGGN